MMEILGATDLGFVWSVASAVQRPRDNFLDPGSRPNAVDLSLMPLIQNPCFRRGLCLVIPAEAGIQVFLILPGPRPSPG
jgi:hypothetical protein